MKKNEVKKVERSEVAKNMHAWREKDAELVSGIFKNLENRGGSVSFNYKMYPGDPFTAYYFRDGERYTIPRGVARHLNNNCYYKEYKHLPGEFGDTGVRSGYNDGRLNSRTQMQTAQKVHRFAFQSLEFSDDDIEMKPNNLIEVTLTP